MLELLRDRTIAMGWRDAAGIFHPTHLYTERLLAHGTLGVSIDLIEWPQEVLPDDRIWMLMERKDGTRYAITTREWQERGFHLPPPTSGGE